MSIGINIEQKRISVNLEPIMVTMTTSKKKLIGFVGIEPGANRLIVSALTPTFFIKSFRVAVS